jgi:NADH dehydrogenase FAD-containing subunit
MAEPGSPAAVLIVGGGVATLETLMALRDLAGDRVRVTLVAAEPDSAFIPVDRHGCVDGLDLEVRLETTDEAPVAP